MDFFTDSLEYCKDCKEETKTVCLPQDGFYCCFDCGLIVDQYFDTSHERRSFAQNDEISEDLSRTGSVFDDLFSGQYNLSTKLVENNCSKQKAVHHTIIKTHNKLTKSSKKDTFLRKAFETIQDFAYQLNLKPRVVETAKYHLKTVENNRPGQNVEAMAAACLIFACRKDGIPMQLKTLGNIAGVAPKNIRQCMTGIRRKHTIKASVCSSEDHIAKYCTLLRLPKEIQERVCDVVSKAQTTNLFGSAQLKSIIGGAVLFSSDLKPIEVAKIIDVALVTLRLKYKIFLDNSSLFEPNELPILAGLNPEIMESPYLPLTGTGSLVV